MPLEVGGFQAVGGLVAVVRHAVIRQQQVIESAGRPFRDSFADAFHGTRLEALLNHRFAFFRFNSLPHGYACRRAHQLVAVGQLRLAHGTAPRRKLGPSIRAVATRSASKRALLCPTCGNSVILRCVDWGRGKCVYPRRATGTAILPGMSGSHVVATGSERPNGGHRVLGVLKAQ